MIQAPLPEGHKLGSDGPYSLSLRGLNDPEFNRLLEARDESGSLVIYAKPENERLATFSLVGQTLRFQWQNRPMDGLKDHIRAIKACVVSVEPKVENSRDRKVYRFALRRPVQVPLLLTLDPAQLGLKKPIRWGNTEKPYKRALEILNCQSSSDLVVPAKVKSGDKETPGFKFVSFDQVALKPSVIQPTERAGPGSECYVRVTLDPDADTVRKTLATEMNSYFNKLISVLQGNDRFGGVVDEAYQSFAKLADYSESTEIDTQRIDKLLDVAHGKLEAIVESVQAEVKSLRGRNRNKESKERMDDREKITEQLEAVITKLKGILVDFRELQVKIDRSFKILKQLREIRSDPRLRETKLGLALAIDVDGDTVEVARIGDVGPMGKDQGAAPRGRE
jgi:hypothetical protein